MKLIVILSIEEHTKEVQKLFADLQIPVYTRIDAKGYKLQERHPDISNWFTHGSTGTHSNVFLSFTDADSSTALLDAVKAFNEEHEDSKNYPLHAYELDVARSV
jgi:hypothetical protein